MSDISIPGVTESQYKTDKIITGLVKTKEIQLDRMQEDRDTFELQRNVWQSINILTNKLETNARTLYNVDSPFRQKFSSSSNESVLTVTNSRQIENGEYTVRLLEVAQADSLRSNEIANDFQVPSGTYTFGTGSDSKQFTFRGGSLKQFVVVANRQLRSVAQFNIVNSRGQKQVLVLRANDSGLKNRLQFIGAGRELALDIGMILDAGSLQMDLLQESLISPFNQLSSYQLSQGEEEVSIGPGQELRISLPNRYTVREGSVMRYSILSPNENLPPISNTPDNMAQTSRIATAPRGSEPLRAEGDPQVLDSPDENYLQFNSRDARDIPPPPSAEFDDIQIDSAGSETAFIGIQPEIPVPSSVEPSRVGNDEWGDNGQELESEGNPAAQNINSQDRDPQDENVQDTQAPVKEKIGEMPQPIPMQPSSVDLLNPTANFYFVQQDRRIAAGPKEGEVQASAQAHEEILSLNSIALLRTISDVVIRNPNPDREIVIQDLRFEDVKISDSYLPNHPVSVAQNAKISYLGVEAERGGNQVEDLLPGLTLNLKRAKPDEDILIRTEPDYDAITQKVADFVNAYNDLMTQLNVVSSNSDVVIREKTSFTEKQEEEAREVLGLLQGDSSVSSLKNRLTMTIAEGYLTTQGTRVLSDIGISTNLGGFGGGIDQSKLRGYLEFDTEIFQKAMEENFAMVQDLFGRDNDGDFIVDSGSAIAIERISRRYTQPKGPIPERVQNLKRSIDDSERRIADYQDYLKDYEVGLKRKYGRMEGALNQLNQQQQSLENFSNSMNRR